MWEKVISRKVGFRVWLPNSSEAGEGKEEPAENQASRSKREGCWSEKEETRQRTEDRCKHAQFGRKIRFSSKSKLFLITGRISHSLQLPPELGAGCSIKKIRQDLVWAAETVCSGVALLGLCRCWSTRSDMEVLLEEPVLFQSHPLQLSLYATAQRALLPPGGCCCSFPHAFAGRQGANAGDSLAWNLT